MMEKWGAKFVGDMERTTRQHGWGMGAGGAK
jgi:hypothetical protein